ncbi:MAG: hypothetical protein V3T58_02535 [Candidatus Hydrothermarchaeales archaeon]
MEKLGWKVGEELAEEVKDSTLLLKPGHSKKIRKKKIFYEKFMERIRGALEETPEGLTWMEIRSTKNLPQKLPNNIWVRRLESDIGLRRKKQGYRTVWMMSGG